MDNLLVAVEIIEIKEEIENVKTFTLRSKNSQKFSFMPGQFIKLYVNLPHNESVKRSYSIGSSPLETQHIKLTIEKFPNGKLTGYFCENAKVNQTYFVSRPKGKFYFEEHMKNITLIAAGTGLVPMMSIIKYCTEKNLDTKINLLYSARRPTDILFKDELKRLESKNKNLNINITLTRLNGETWKGKVGRINLELIQNAVKDLHQNTFFLCGSLEFVRDMASLLSDLGIDRKKIKRDVWT